MRWSIPPEADLRPLLLQRQGTWRAEVRDQRTVALWGRKSDVRGLQDKMIEDEKVGRLEKQKIGRKEG